MNQADGEPLNELVRQYQSMVRPVEDWKSYQEWPQRILNNLGTRWIASDDLSMQAQLYWVITNLLGEVERLRSDLYDCQEEVGELEEQLSDAQQDQ